MSTSTSGNTRRRVEEVEDIVQIDLCKGEVEPQAIADLPRV